MRSVTIASLSVLLLLPGTVSAGQIYGTIRDGTNPLRSAKIEVACPDFRQGSIPITGQTDNLGSFSNQCGVTWPLPVARGECRTYRHLFVG